jgi:hypothetical protein
MQTEGTNMFHCSCVLFKTPCHFRKNDYKTSSSNPTYVNLFINAFYFTRILYYYNSLFPFKLPLFHPKTNLQSLICTTDTRICTNLFCDWHHTSKNFPLTVFSRFPLSPFADQEAGEISQFRKFSYYLNPQPKILLPLSWNLYSLVVPKSNMYEISILVCGL